MMTTVPSAAVPPDRGVFKIHRLLGPAMLSVFDNRHGCSRREFLRIGSLGLGGLCLPQLPCGLGDPSVSEQVGGPALGLCPLQALPCC